MDTGSNRRSLERKSLTRFPNPWWYPP